MSKKKSKKSSNKSMLTGLVIALMGVLLLLPLFVPVITSIVDGDGKIDASAITLLSAKSIYDEKTEQDTASEAVQSAYSRYFVWAPAKAELEKEGGSDKAISAVSTLSVMALICGIVGGLGILLGIASLFSKAVSKYVGFYALLMAVVGVVTFIMGLIAAGATSSVLSANIIIGTLTTTTKASIGIATILALIGGILAGVAPFAIKKYAK